MTSNDKHNASREYDNNSSYDFFPIFTNVLNPKCHPSGSYASIISEFDKQKFFLNVTLTKSDLKLTSYSDITLHPVGMINNLVVNFVNKEKRFDLYVVKGPGPILIGRQWLREFDLWPIKLNSINSTARILTINSNVIRQQMLDEFPNLFSNTQGCYTGRKVKLIFKDDIKPIQLKPYHAPFAHSKWPEIINMKNNRMACKLINVMDELFSRYGIPYYFTVR